MFGVSVKVTAFRQPHIEDMGYELENMTGAPEASIDQASQRLPMGAVCHLAAVDVGRPKLDASPNASLKLPCAVPPTGTAHPSEDACC